MQVIQPVTPTPRQTSLQSLASQLGQGLVVGANNYVAARDKALERDARKAATDRQAALQAVTTAADLRSKGYDVTPDQVHASLTGDPAGFSGLFNNRTAEWTQQQSNLREQQQLDNSYKKSMTAKNYSEAGQNTPTNKIKTAAIAKQAGDLADKNANLFNVKQAMDAAVAQLEDTSLSEDARIKVGQSLLKLLNSAEGSDAVGAEEARRLGSFLEYKMANFTQPGSFWGRDLGAFTDQVKNNSNLLADRIKKNQEGFDHITSGGSIATAPGATPKHRVSAPPPGPSFGMPSAHAAPTGSPWKKYGGGR